MTINFIIARYSGYGSANKGKYEDMKSSVESMLVDEDYKQ